MLTSKFMTSQRGNNKFQYTYCPISQDVKEMRQRNLVTWQDIGAIKSY